MSININRKAPVTAPDRVGTLYSEVNLRPGDPEIQKSALVCLYSQFQYSTLGSIIKSLFKKSGEIMHKKTFHLKHRIKLYQSTKDKRNIFHQYLFFFSKYVKGTSYRNTAYQLCQLDKVLEFLWTSGFSSVRDILENRCDFMNLP